MMTQAKMKCRKPAHGQTDNVSSLLADVIEHGENIISRTRLRILRDFLRHIRGRKPPRIICNRTISFAKMTHLRLETAHIAREFMNENESTARSRLPEI